MTRQVREEIMRGEAMFEAGRFDEALGIFEAVLSQDPHNDGALNDAGLACAEVGREAQSIAYFKRALLENPANANAFYNLIDLLVREGDMRGAADMYMRWGTDVAESDEKRRYHAALFPPLTPAGRPQMIVSHPLVNVPDPKMSVSHPLVNVPDPKLSVSHPQVNASHPHVSVSHPQVSVSKEELPTLSSLEDIVRSDVKVAFVCFRNDHFVRDIEQAIAARQEVRVLHFDYGQVDLNAVQEMMDWADVTWFEWFDALVVEASRRLRKSSRVICRLHRFEAFTEWPLRVNWDFIDTLVLVAPHVLDVLRARRPDLLRETEVEIIYNGVDMDRCAFRERQPGFDIACIADLRSRKNPSLMLQCVDALRKEDDRYVLHLAGDDIEPEARLYFDHMIDRMELSRNVRCYGLVRDVNAWLDDKNYLLSTSIHESFEYGIAEAMARGIKPIIHHFPGAERLFPRRALFTSISEFVERVRENDFDSRRYRAFIEAHYSLTEQVDRIEALLMSMSSSPRSRIAV